MNRKIKTLVLCAVLSASTFGAFAQIASTDVAPVQTATCDASNQNKCVITNVGEGTGALKAEQ